MIYSIKTAREDICFTETGKTAIKTGVRKVIVW